MKRKERDSKIQASKLCLEESVHQVAEGNVELWERVLEVKGVDSGMFSLVMRMKVLRMMDSPWGRI